MIRSFRCPETQKIFHLQGSRKFPGGTQRRALRKLKMLNNSSNLGDLLAPPSNRLEKLRGSREGQYRIRINSQWRICFNWEKGEALNVEIVDYH